MPGAATVPLRGVSGRTPPRVGGVSAGDGHLEGLRLRCAAEGVVGVDDGLEREAVAHELLTRSVVHPYSRRRRLIKCPQTDGNPSRDRRMTVPTRPPGEQTSVSVRNATGVRGNAYAAKLGWQAKAVATFAQHTLKWKVRRPAALAWVSIIEAGLFAAASCTSIRRNRKACWVPADEPSWSAIMVRALSGTRWPCAAACRGSQEISWDSLAHRHWPRPGGGPTSRARTSPMASSPVAAPGIGRWAWIW